MLLPTSIPPIRVCSDLSYKVPLQHDEQEECLDECAEGSESEGGREGLKLTGRALANILT